jgi:polyisoprenoid-binding protein YceI
MKAFYYRNIYNNVLIVLSSLVCCPAFAQLKYHSVNSSVTISGTSTLHDWTEHSNMGSAAASFAISNDKITGLSSLTFTVPAKSIKSDHKSMDAQTYKALNADKYANINYVLSSATVTPVDATTFSVKTKGRLTIAGTTRETEVTGTARLNADHSIVVTGSKKFKMTDFNVKPPSVMLGSVKAGNDLTVSYNLNLHQ